MSDTTARALRLLAACALAALAVSVAALSADAGAQDRPGDEERAKSAALRGAPTVRFVPGAPGVPPYAARHAAGPHASRVPVPDGGNFSGIRFEEAEGELTDADLEHVLQYNAACQWYRALDDGRQATLARDILSDVPHWSTFRDNDKGALWQAALSELAAGGGPTADAVALDCEATHDREVVYARSRAFLPAR